MHSNSTTQFDVLDFLKPAAFVAFPFIGGLVGAVVSMSQIKTWYRHLNKAPWSPPDWAFGPIWTCLYACMGYASWLVYSETGFMSTPMYLYLAQLVLNWAWSLLFFGAHRVFLALVDIVATLGLVVACVILFYPINLVASILMMPYVVWLALATSLNVYILLYNNLSKGTPGDNKSKSSKKKDVQLI